MGKMHRMSGRGGAQHELLIERLSNERGLSRTNGFYRTLRAALPVPLGRDYIVPDAWAISKAERRVELLEVVETCGIGSRKWMVLAGIQAQLLRLGWSLRVVVVHTDGREAVVSASGVTAAGAYAAAMTRTKPRWVGCRELLHVATMQMLDASACTILNASGDTNAGPAMA